MAAVKDDASADVFAAWELPLLELTEFLRLDAASTQVLGDNQARHLLSYSLLAPSSHNTVPQAYRLSLEQNQIEVWLRRQHVLPESDPTGKEALVSVGCAVESLILAAQQYGIGATWQVAADLDWSLVTPAASASEVLIGCLELRACPAPDEASRRSVLLGMQSRRTVRAEFDESVRLSPALRGALEGAATPAQRVMVFESVADKFAWGKLDELATKHKLEESGFRRELGQWLLPNLDRHSARGMRGREFGFDDRVTLALAAGLRGEAPLAVDQLAFLARAGRVGLCSSSAVCVLSSSDQSAAGAVASGRVFQRCVLLAAASGLSYAVHTAICHVPHARAMSSATLLQSRVPSVIFRVGKPRQAHEGIRVRSSRPTLDELLLRSGSQPGG